MEEKTLKDFDLVGFMEKLAERRPVFHNESDFQFMFAQLAQEEYKTDVRLECCFESEKQGNRIKRNYIDIVLFNNDKECLLIELKYKIKELDKTKKEKLKKESPLQEDFDLPNQGAQDLGSYACLADLHRLEKLNHHGNGKFNGYKILAYYSILLTNDYSYLKQHNRSVFKDFYLAENKERKVIENTLHFPKETTTSQKAGGDLQFNEIYDYEWRDYSNVYDFKWVYIRNLKGCQKQ